MMLRSDFRFRRGDVIRFARGANEYAGTVKRTSPRLKSLLVSSDDLGDVRLYYRHVLALEVPVVTEKERAAILVFRGRLWDPAKKQWNQVAGVTVDQGRKEGLNGSLLRSLETRGLVHSMRFSTSESEPFTWSLTAEGKRVAEALD